MIAFCRKLYDLIKSLYFSIWFQAYSNAIRICKEQGNLEQLWSLAILASSNEKLDAAKYFESCDRPQYDKAVILYEKAGYVGKAMDLAFDKRQHNVLQYIANNFDQVEIAAGTNQWQDISGAKLNGLNFQNTDPSLLDRTANFFLEHKQVWLQSGTLRLELTN